MELKIQASDFENLVRQSCGTGAFVGRHSEKGTLYKRMDRVREGKGSLLFLIGPSGSGKTRLAQAAARRARRRGDVVCTGACGPDRGPYAPFVEALQKALSGPLPSRVRNRLNTCLSTRPELAELIGWYASPEAYLSELSIGKESLFQALAHALILLSHGGPALLVVEDLHLADGATLEFLKYLAVRIRMHRLLVLAACRTDEEGKLSDRLDALVDELHKRYETRCIPLGGLDTQEADDLIRSVYKKNLFSDALRQGLQRGTEGNPAAMLEALRYLQAQGIIFEEGGIWRERREEAPTAVPSELYETVARRLEALPPDTVQFLRLAAAFGNRFDPDVIKQAMGINRIRFLGILGALKREHGVFVPEEECYTFASERLREVLYRRVPSDLIQPLHLALAKGLEKVHAGCREKAVVPLAEHYSLGGDLENAVPCLMAAGDRDHKFAAYGQAVEYYERALDILDKIDPGRGTAEVQAQVRQRAAAAHTCLKHWPRAEAHLRVQLSISRTLSDRKMEADGWKGIGRIYAKRKIFDRALTLYQRSLRLFREVKDATGECVVLVGIGSLHLELGQWQDLQTVYSRALRIARELRHDQQIATISMNLGIMHNIRGNTAGALEAFHRCIRVYRRLGLWDRVAGALLNTGKCLADRGDYTEAKKCCATSLKMARKRYDLQLEAVVQLNLGEILMKEGDLRESRAMCEKALKLLEEIDHRVGMADASRILGCLAARREDNEPAEACFEKSIAMNSEIGYKLGEAEARRDYAGFLQDRGRSDLSLEMFEKARDIFSKLGVKKEVEHIDSLIAENRRAD